MKSGMLKKMLSLKIETLKKERVKEIPRKKGSCKIEQYTKKRLQHQSLKNSI